MAAQPRPGVEGLEAEGFRLGRRDDLPDVDVHAVEGHLELVHESDVDRPVDVLEELAGETTVPNQLGPT